MGRPLRTIPVWQADAGTALTAGQALTLTKMRALGLQRIVGEVRSDAAFASGYPRVQFSPDGENWIRTVALTRDDSDATNYLYKIDEAITDAYVRVQVEDSGGGASDFGGWLALTPDAGGAGGGAAAAASASGFTLVESNAATQFTTAISPGSQEDENLAGLPSDSVRIRSLTLMSVQAIDWIVTLWSTDGFDDSAIGTSSPLAAIELDSVDAVGTGYGFVYTVHGLDIPYLDEDGSQELHVSLAAPGTAKNSSPSGAVRLRFLVEQG